MLVQNLQMCAQFTNIVKQTNTITQTHTKMGNLKRNKNTNETALTKHISIRVPKEMYSEIAKLSASKVQETGELVSFTDTVVGVLELGLEKAYSNKSVA